MNKSSSNNQMEDSFDKLKSIKRVAAPDNLYNKILSKTDDQKVIPMKWINIAAALFFFLLVSEIYLISENKFTSREDSQIDLVTLPNNMLYHE